ncbi:unnamed protein product [Blepharisma stoltei]|uniref:Cyclin n=1 Tax=Blepharisma stoltei TaxID=1481888 RepID=A0AAU9K8L7_9CILI|nr:unnamed protein product [Blepharisma stoltei]
MSVLGGMHHTLIGRLASSGELEQKNEIFDIFNRARPLPMDLLSFLGHLQDRLCCSDVVFTLGFVLLDKILKSYPAFSLTNRNIHRIVFTSVSLAFKFSEDITFSNAALAKIGLVTTEELLRLEASFLAASDWCIWSDEISKNLEEYLDVFSKFETKKEASNYDSDESSTEETSGSFEDLSDFSELSAFFTSENSLL